MTSGVRCADTIRTSCDTWNSDSTSTAPCMTRRSESLPMITPTRGLEPGTSGKLARPPGPSLRPVRTRLTELLEVEHPVMLAGMGGVSYHRLVAAVSEAGGFGCLGAGTMGTEEMVDEIRRVRAATTRPF